MTTAQQFQLPPSDGFVVTHFLVVSDQDRSRDYYTTVFGAQVVRERDPVILQLANTWLILNDGGGPTADKPTVTLTTPPDPDTVSAFLNIRVADIHTLQREWTARGAHFLTDPVEHPSEFRSYIRDPDGHLIEVGQSRTA
jgi:lactoylglutathione lyase